MNELNSLMSDPVPTPEAETLAGEILARIALDANGQPFADEPSAWTDADEAEPQVVSLGSVRFAVVDPDARTLAQQLGAVDPDYPDAAAMVVQAEDPDALTTGRYVAVETAAGVSVVLRVFIAAADLNDPTAPDFGPTAHRDPALDVIRLHPGRALLVQVFAEE
ncbi:MAG: hypothetical protein EOP81_02260 [Variovorax sp.]|nr:MAG: hypothetical protein EOP81_02260 [Variovorax sp.]